MAGSAVNCHHCGANFVLPDLPARHEELPPPADGSGVVRKVLFPLLTGAAVVLGASIFVAKDPLNSTPTRPVMTQVPPPAATPMPAPSPVNLPKTPLLPKAIVPSVQEAPPAVEQELAAAKPSLPSSDSAVLLPGPLPESMPVSGVPAPDLIPPATAGEPKPEPPVKPAASPIPGKIDAAEIRKDSRTTLERFLLASTLEERLAVSQNPEKIRAEMEAYYQANPSGPLELVELALLTEGEVPETNRKFELYNVSLKDRNAPIPVAVEQTADGFRVDWQTFSESCSHRLRDFFSAPSEERARFRVLLRRAHYFGPPVPGQDTLRTAYTIEPPVRDETFTAWVDLDSNVYREKLATGERSSWEAESYVIVELIWRGDGRRGRWVGLNRIVSDSWRQE